MTEFLNVPGGRIGYDVTGPDDAPLVVCAPGMGDLRGAFRFLAPELVAAGYRVAACDLRGHGESSSPWSEYGCRHTGDDILALVRHLGGRASVLGQSSSTTSAIWAAAQDPDAVTATILIGPFVRDRTLNPLMRLLSAAVTHSASLWAGRFYPTLYKAGKPADFADYQRALRANLREPGRMAAMRGLIGTAAECTARIPEMRSPVLVVMGSKDPDFPDPVAEARWVADQISPYTEVSVEIVEGAGHVPHAELPGVTAAAVTTFLAGAARA